MKKGIAVLLSTIMALSLTACGSASAPKEETESAAEVTVASSMEESEVGESEESTEQSAMFSDGWGDTNNAFDPLAIEETWTFEEMRQNLGDIPVDSNKEISLAGNIRTNDNVYWQSLAKGYQAMTDLCAENGVNAKIDIESALNESDTEGQLSVMKDQIRLGVNAIMISPISTSNCTEGVETAHTDNIPCISVNNEFNGADMFIGPNSYDEGKVAADWANENVGEGKCAIIMGLAGTDVVKNRTNGFKDELETLGSKISVVDSQNADWDRNTAKDVCATFLKTYDDLKIIFCNNDVMALGAVEAVKEAGKVLNKDIYVIGMDGTDEAYQSIKSNELSATVSMFPYYEGMMATEVTMRIMLGQETPKVIWTPAMVIDASSVTQDDAELINWTNPTFK